MRWSRRFLIAAPGWRELATELDRWPTATAALWWRDDDAIADTSALQRLLRLRAALDVPLTLAVIPARAEPSLAAALNPVGPHELTVLVHGWDHRNHAAPDAPAEFSAGRSQSEVLEQLRAGLGQIAMLFGPRFLPVLVPPFNRLATGLVGTVRRAGFSHVSIDRDFAGLGMPSRNVHADVVDWRRMTAAPAVELVRALLAALRLRRFGLVDARAPIGVLTHHLVHDEATWGITEALLARLRAHPAVRFRPVQEIFAQ